MQCSDMAQQPRPIEIKFHVSPEEKAIIDKKKHQMGTNCTATYCRKMSLDGFVVKLDFAELRDWTSNLRRTSNNFNQIAKRVNSTNRIYDADIENMRETLDDLWNGLNELLTRLAIID
jgi:uncharacterized phage infection (PIP) family protein YhgE